MVALYHGDRSDRIAVRFRQGVHGVAANEEVGQLHRWQLTMRVLYLSRIEHGQAIVGGKAYQVIISVQSDTIDILLGGETVAIDVSDELSLLGIVLP